MAIPERIEVKHEGDTLSVTRTSQEKRVRALHGTIRSLLANMVEGVHKGFERVLMIEGVGYRAVLDGPVIALSLGYSHVIRFPIPDGIEIAVDGQTTVTVRGKDKQQVGEVSARIRGFAPAEPYKGKGVRYKDEKVRRKVGKAVA
jgi:large subunit ribosomal protein L6